MHAARGYVRFIVFFFLSATVYRMYLEVLLLLVLQIVVQRQVQIAKEDREEDVVGRVKDGENCKGGAKKIAFSANVKVIIRPSPPPSLLPINTLQFKFILVISRKRIQYYMVCIVRVFYIVNLCVELLYKHYTSRLFARYSKHTVLLCEKHC